MQEQKVFHIPEYLDCPAFLVENDIIVHVNTAAQHRQIAVGTNILDLICTGSQEYGAFQSGKLFLRLNICNIKYQASVTVHENAHLFCLLSDYESTELQALALAGSFLRRSLHEVLNGVKALGCDLPDDTPSDVYESIGQINHGLYQMMRTVGNMTDAVNFPQHRISQFEYKNVKNIFDSLAAQLQDRSDQLNRVFQYTGLSQPVYTMLDKQALERAFYNMVSNAIKFSPKDSIIQIRVAVKNGRLYITVKNSCAPNSIPVVRFFDRYLREPGIEDARYGIGLGLTLIRTIAAAHRGTVLMEPGDGKEISVSMTLAIQNDTTSVIMSPFAPRVQYNNRFDTELVELSDLLPSANYKEL